MCTKQQLILSYHWNGKSIRSISGELRIHRSTEISYMKDYEELRNSQNSSVKEDADMDALAQELSKVPSYDSSS